jgi:hypothetical protein
MWLHNKKTGRKWFITDEDHRKRVLKTGDFEPVEADVEEKANRKKQTNQRDGK